MPEKFDPSNKDVLVSDDRRRHLDIHRVLSLLPIQPYHTVADIGAGPGYFTIPLAKYLFDGKVYALDVQQEMLDATKTALESIRLTNTELLLSEETKLPLEKSSLDGALMAFVLQEANDRKGLLKDANRALCNGGWLAILEWYKKETESGPPVAQRIDEADMLKLVTAAGFRFTARHEVNKDQYMLILRKQPKK
jgi:ubiquinone/menaquinone biosynthesis C-methylase UbiE